MSSWNDFTIVAVDDRYLIVGGLEFRLSVSFGPNVTKKLAGGLLAPTLREGENVFGIHLVHTTNDDEVDICDSWIDSRDAQGVKTEGEIMDAAREILASINDEEYKVQCTSVGEIGEFGRRHLS